MFIVDNKGGVIIPDNTNCITSNEKHIMEEFEKHFLSLTFWTRLLLTSMKFDLPNSQEIYDRLIEETNHFEKLMYELGQSNPEIFKNYMVDFIVTFRNLAIAEMSNNSQLKNKSFENMLQITNKISEYFYNLNPQSDLDQWHQLFHTYVQMLYSEINLIFNDDYKGDIDLFDKLINQSYLLADYIASTLFSRMSSKPKDKKNTNVCHP